MTSLLLHPAIPKLRRFIYRALGWVNALHDDDEHLVVLCYHGIGSDAWRFGVTFDAFIEQIEYLEGEGYRAVSIDVLYDALERGVKLPAKSFIVTFDDGYRDVLLVKHVLAKKGIRPALFVLAEPESVVRDELGTGRQFLSHDEILELHQAGWEIGCHSATHADFSRLDEAALERETALAKTHLEEKLGLPIRYFAYPKGFYNTRIRAAVEGAGYRGAVSMDDGFIGTTTDPFAVPRVGVDRTHTMAEFSVIFLPAAIVFRRMVKALLSFKDRAANVLESKKIFQSL